MTSPSPSDGFLGLPIKFTDVESAGCVIIPVPFEATSTFGRGSGRGPAAVIEASHEVELFDAALGFEPFRRAGGIHTMSPLDCDGCDGERIAGRLHDAALPFFERGRFVVTLGGEHTSVVGAVRAACECRDDVTVVQFDAHSDLRDEYEGTRWNHASAMARILDFNERIIQVAIRSQCAEERALIDERGIPVFYAHEISEADDSWIDRVIEKTSGAVYVTFDCDAFDPSVIPATGTPEPGGLSWRQVDAFFAALSAKRRLVGMDISELAPIEGMLHPQFTIARLTSRVIGYAASQGR
jgi:agmatinase